MSSQGGSKAVVAALSANAGIAVTKFLAFLLTGSSSMLAESVHSLADCANQLLLLLGDRRSRRAPTPEHPFGYGRERYVYGFVVAIVLFSIGGLFALYEAWHKLGHPEPIRGRWTWVPLVILVLAILMEGLSFRTAIRESNHSRGARSWVQFVRGAKAPELPVVLLEDFAALIGLVFALCGVGLTIITGNGRWDAAGTALIGALLVAVAVILAIEMKSLLLGEAAHPEDVAAITAALVGDADSNIDAVIHLRTMHLGPEEVLVGAKVAVGAGDRIELIARAIDQAEARARAAVPALTLVMYLEPDLARTSSARPG